MVPRARTFVGSATQLPVLGRPGFTGGLLVSRPVGVGAPGAVGLTVTVGAPDGGGAGEPLGSTLGCDDGVTLGAVDGVTLGAADGEAEGPGLGAESFV